MRLLYELQANWYTLGVDSDFAWLTSKAKIPLMFAKMFVTLGLHLFTAGIATRIAGELYLEIIPNIDKGSAEEDKNLDYFGPNSSTDLYDKLSEPLLLKVYHNLNPVLVRNEVDIHSTFSHVIESAYFGKLDILLYASSSDQIIFRDLNNYFYKKIRGIFEDSCASLMPEISQGSPFLNWLTFPEEKIAKCSVYNVKDSFRDREEIIEILGESDRGGFMQQGTEGGRGPGLQIHPQLLIK